MWEFSKILKRVKLNEVGFECLLGYIEGQPCGGVWSLLPVVSGNRLSNVRNQSGRNLDHWDFLLVALWGSYCIGIWPIVSQIQARLYFFWNTVSMSLERGKETNILWPYCDILLLFFLHWDLSGLNIFNIFQVKDNIASTYCYLYCIHLMPREIVYQ